MPADKMLVHKKIPSDLLIIFIWVIITRISIFTPAFEGIVVRTILAVPVVLFIPGYALTAALFPKKDDLEAVERIALSFGTSIAVVPLLGILLNFIFRIDMVPILSILCLSTIALVFIAAYRRRKLPADMQFSVKFNRLYETFANEVNAPLSRRDFILTVVLIFTIAFAAGMVYFVFTTPKIGERFTEFYILNPSGEARDYSANLKSNSPATFLVGVVNHEYTPVNYTVQVALDKNILTHTEFILNNNETWEKNITFIPGKEGTGMRLEFWLFKDNNYTAPYRELQLWVNVTK